MAAIANISGNLVFKNGARRIDDRNDGIFQSSVDKPEKFILGHLVLAILKFCIEIKFAGVCIFQ